MCPKCRSQYLGVREPTGIERTLILLSQTRKYRCGDCYYELYTIREDLPLELDRSALGVIPLSITATPTPAPSDVPIWATPIVAGV
jgi:hypothetical protein